MYLFNLVINYFLMYFKSVTFLKMVLLYFLSFFRFKNYLLTCKDILEVLFFKCLNCLNVLPNLLILKSFYQVKFYWPFRFHNNVLIKLKIYIKIYNYFITFNYHFFFSFNYRIFVCLGN